MGYSPWGREVRHDWNAWAEHTHQSTYVNAALSVHPTLSFPLSVVMWINLEVVIQSEVSQKEKNKYHILMHMYITYIYNLEKRYWWTYLQRRKRDTDVDNGHVEWSHVSWLLLMGFPDSSVGKESTCNAGDPRSIPGSGRSTEEGIGYPLRYSWASLVAQLVKNLLVMRETWVRSLGWEDPLEKGKATHSSILAWRIPWAV